MGKKNSNSLQQKARSLGVKDEDYFPFRKAVLKYLDKESGSRDNTAALNRDSTEKFLDNFIDTPTAQKYATNIQDSEIRSSQNYDNTLPVLLDLTCDWVRNLKKKKKPSRKTTITAGKSRPTMIDLDGDEDLIQALQPDLATQLPSTSRNKDSRPNPPLEIADEGLRTDAFDSAITTDRRTSRLGTSSTQPTINVSGPSRQLHLGTDNNPHAGPSNLKRKYDEISSHPRGFQECEEEADETADETEDEQDDQHRRDVLQARAGKRVMLDEEEAPPILHPELFAKPSMLPNTPGTARTFNTSIEFQSPPPASLPKTNPATLPMSQENPRLPSNSPAYTRHYSSLAELPSPPAHELSFWPNIFYHMIRERQRSIVAERTRIANNSVEDVKILDAVSNTLQDLHNRVEDIVGALSWRLA